jgi:hypothetical protein
MGLSRKVKTQIMNNQFGTELLRKNSSSFSVAIVFLSINLGLFLLSIFKSHIILGIPFLIGILVVLLIIVKLKTTIFYDKHIVQITFWKKKIIWYCLYEEIQRINISYFSDTFYRSKQACFILNDGSRKKITLVHILLETLVKPFIDKGIPVYVEINGKYRPYNLLGNSVHTSNSRDNRSEAELTD